MTVSASTSRADYNGNGITATFTVPFYFLDNAHIVVYKTVVATGVVTTLVLDSDYSVSGAGVVSGGSITCSAAPPSGIRISILRDVPLDQQTNYVEGDPFPAASHEQALDKLTMIVQQQAESNSRAITLAPSTSGVSTALPAAVANGLLQWNGSATALTNIDPAAIMPSAITTTPNDGSVTLAKMAASAYGTSGASKLLQLDATGKLPALDASQLTNVVVPPPVRQTVLDGVKSAGVAAALVAGTGLAINLQATATPLVITAASGFNATGGTSDTTERIAADAAGIVTPPANNLSLIYRDLANAWGSTLAPVQYGYTFNRAAQVCMSLNNNALDDYGNTATATGISYSNSSPAISSTYMAVFNGTTSKINIPISGLGNGGHFLRAKIKPTVGAIGCVINACNASGFGVIIGINASGKLFWYLSSNGSTHDIANGTAGTTTLSSGTNYDIECDYDPVAGKYFLYLNGAQELTVTSASKICPVTQIQLGRDIAATLGFYAGDAQDFEFQPYCMHPAGTTFTPSTTLADITAGNRSSDFFSLADWKMNSISAKSTTAGVDPTFTQKTRVYVGEAVAGAASVTSATSYAYQGKYDSGLFAVAASTPYAKNHKLGVQNAQITVNWADDTAGTNERPGLASFTYNGTAAAGAYVSAATKNAVTLTTVANPMVSVGGALQSAGAYRVRAQRGW